MLRVEHDLTQAQFGKKIGVKQKRICLWERGKTLVETNYLVEICRVFKLSLAHFDEIIKYGFV